MMVNGDRTINNNYGMQGNTNTSIGYKSIDPYYSNFNTNMSNSTTTADFKHPQAEAAPESGPKMSLPPISSFVFPTQVASTSLPSFKEVLQSTMPSPITTAVPIYPSMNDSIFGSMGQPAKGLTFNNFNHLNPHDVTSKFHQRESKGKKAVFISLFNSAIQKRPRRKFEEVNRIYGCLHPGCDKKYGALNHLNAHIKTQKHGKFRKAYEFKDNNIEH